MKQPYLVPAVIALALVGASARADMKDPLPDSLSLGGVTLYGTIDIGYAYQSHGVPQNAELPGGLEYQAFTTTRNFGGSVSTVAQSGMEQSRIGVRVLEPIAPDWNLVGAVDSGFNPLSGHFTDACGSFVSNGGLKQGQQTANADSSRCGQVFNNFAFGGVSNSQFGTLTIGRQQSLQLEQLAVYDPQALSYAFSFLGYSGFNGGAGSTQAARWDNSVKYALQLDRVHVAVMYSNGAQDGGLFASSYAADVGATVAGLSVDGTYENAKGAVNLRSSFDDAAGPVPTPGLSAYVSDNTSWNLMGKYVLQLPEKDKLTAYAGYTHIEKSHFTYTEGTAQGGYPIDVPININAPAVYNMEWLGARYAFSSGLNLVAAYYHVTQNSWTVGRGTTGTDGIGCSAAGLLCAGDFNEVSFVADYVFNKHYDLYIGANWSEVTDGLANGFSGTTADGTTGSQTQTTVMFGGRIKF
ncbi:MAG: porin [Gammaproteobacteria bacterium]|nr:porin [Gammaproteobacteria bacterium]